MRVLKSKKGLTVIEVLVALLVITIIFGMVSSIVGFFSRFYSDESQHINRQENMRVLMLQLERDIRMSDQEVDVTGAPCFVIGTGLGSSPIHTYCFVSASNTVERDGVVLARSVQGFSLNLPVGSRALDIDIQMLPDSRGKQLEANYSIFLRQAGP